MPSVVKSGGSVDGSLQVIKGRYVVMRESDQVGDGFGVGVGFGFGVGGPMTKEWGNKSLVVVRAHKPMLQVRSCAGISLHLHL